MITLTGNGFGDTQGDGFLSFESLTKRVRPIMISGVVSWSDTEIVFETPVLSPGSYYLQVGIPPDGYIRSDIDNTVTTVLEVSNSSFV